MTIDRISLNNRAKILQILSKDCRNAQHFCQKIVDSNSLSNLSKFCQYISLKNNANFNKWS